MIDAVSTGFSTAGIITSAALIIVAVFAGMASGGAGDLSAGGLRPRGRRHSRRHDHPNGASASQHGVTGRLELVLPEMARVAAEDPDRGSGGGGACASPFSNSVVCPTSPVTSRLLSDSNDGSRCSTQLLLGQRLLDVRAELLEGLVAGH